MIWRGFVVALLTSQSVWPMMYILGSYTWLRNQFVMLAVGIVVIPGFALLLYSLLPKNFKDGKGQPRQRNAFYYMCCLFAWSSTTSLLLALEGMGLIHGYFDFYLENGEPYLATPFGIWASLWDGTAALLVYLVVIYKHDNGQDYKKWGLYWFGFASAGVLSVNVGFATGVFGNELHPSALLNLPYILAPFVFITHLWDDNQANKRPKKHQISSPMSSFDYLLLMGVVFSAGFGLLRGLAALGSPLPFVSGYVKDYEPYILEPGKFGTVHCLFNFFYGVPVQVMLAYYLVNGARGGTAQKLAIILSGSATAGAVCYLIPSMSSEIAEEFRITENIWTVILLNALPVIISHVMKHRFDDGQERKDRKLK